MIRRKNIAVPEIPDERGNLTLQTDMLPNKAPSANEFIYNLEGLENVNINATARSVSSAVHCFWDPALCQNGFSLSVWLESKSLFVT